MPDTHAISDSTVTLGAEADYECVDLFLRDFILVQAIKGGMETGLLQKLNRTPATCSSLLSDSGFDAKGLEFLLLTLSHYNVVVKNRAEQYELSPEFSKAFYFKEYLQAKIEFSNFLAPDLMQNTTDFLHSEAQFMQSSRLFELFDYHRALKVTPENVQFTRRWVRLTTALTRHEAGVCLAHHDFSECLRIMDIGGNSGEFARQIAEQYPQLFATVVDLPVVCDIGREHTAKTAVAQRLEFYSANALQDPLPGQQCLISFKSVLHDWPTEACERFLQQAYKSLKNTGELLIFERSAIDLTQTPVTFGLLPTALFYRSYRTPEEYIPMLQQCGFRQITIKRLPLETGFHMITARKS
ncbi:hypothetical protein G8770_14575 [Aestuariicella hydrocarbonica]|uniref:O-methyltransferase C-terminal domain-containing protein n=1 Tax=Pseudomaricurvus hydrocarbonicus TaxID=1470433 RepID=A0A9E5MLC1_9GAMM|nr:methyltransferase [Aestuariicella hydrocarbonica]NHO66772.1 hypothetical protein [Aestuariicella hydrocarbonica]